jgi:preprotein translocase subunit SecG
MQQLIIMLHVLICICLVALVLVQHGKGADMGAGFGSGASGTLFGSQGTTPFLVKVTGLLAGIFFMTSLGLSYLVSKRIGSGVQDVTPITMPVIPVSDTGNKSQTPN